MDTREFEEATKPPFGTAGRRTPAEDAERAERRIAAAGWTCTYAPNLAPGWWWAIRDELGALRSTARSRARGVAEAASLLDEGDGGTVERAAVGKPPTTPATHAHLAREHLRLAAHHMRDVMRARSAPGDWRADAAAIGDDVNNLARQITDAFALPRDDGEGGE